MKKTKLLSALIGLSLLSGTWPVYAADLPAYYDLRLTNPTDRTSSVTTSIIPAIRDQGIYDTCWAFASIASLETSLNQQLQKAGLGPVDRLSERYLAWLTYAAPVNGGGDGYVQFSNTAITTVYDVFEQGGNSLNSSNVLVRYGVAYNSECPYDLTPNTSPDMQGASLSGRGTALHDFYLTDDLFNQTHLRDRIAYYKQFLQNEGCLNITINASLTESVKEQDFYTSTVSYTNHGVVVIGWDDAYTITDTSGKVHTGAWLVRNSWGTGDSKGGSIGDKGYYYLSYDDANAFSDASFRAETDWGRYTTVNSAALGAANASADFHPFLRPTGGCKIANRLTSGASQLLKAIGFTVTDDSMSYKLDISLKGETPDNTTTIYTQSGTFGADGTAKYRGYRTVDLNKFVYLPEGQNYLVTVTMTGEKDKTYIILLNYNPRSAVAAGTSFAYDASAGRWVDMHDIYENWGGTNAYLAATLYALNKYSSQANGGDFTVVSLNDGGAGGSKVYLGRKDELYTTDLLHPVKTAADGTTTATGVPRYTLSNMTVDLTRGLTDSVYGGEISGEGQVIKTGSGMLALTGTNTYTGATSVKAGSFALTGSLQSPVTVADGGIFTGTGTINGNLINAGTLVPGLTTEAQALLGSTSPLGTLTVAGNLTSTGNLQIAVKGLENSKLVVGGTANLKGTTASLTSDSDLPVVNHPYNYLIAKGGVTSTVNQVLSPYLTAVGTTDGTNAYMTARQTQILGSLPGESASEKSVGDAFNSLILNKVAADPTSTTGKYLNGLLYQDENSGRRFTKQVTSEGRAQLLQQGPLSHLTSETVYSRLDAVDFNGLAEAEVKLPHLTGSKKAAKSAAAEYGDSVMGTTTPVTLDSSNNLWFKLFKGYETYNYNDDLKNHSFGGAVGYDHALNLTTRVGGLFSYGVTNYSTDNMSGSSHDWRVGAYVDHRNGNWDYQGLLSYGHNKYDLDREVLGAKLNSDYQAKVWDVEAKAKYLIPSTRAKTWQFTPYGKVSYTHTNQDAYSETGNSLFAQNLESGSYNSTRGEIGLEFKRAYDKHGGFGGSVGYKRVISGVNPELNGTFAGDDHNFTIRGDNDRNFVTYSLNVHGSLGGRWTGQAELRGEASPHTHKEIISVAAKYHF